MTNSFNRGRRPATKRRAAAPAAQPAEKVQFNGEEQLVETRYYNDAKPAQVIFEGLVPLQFKTDRTRGMQWIELRDRDLADREAIAAEAEQIRIETEAATPLAPDPLEVATAAGAQAGELQQQVAELRKIVSQLQMATGEQVITGGLQISRVAAGTEEIRSALDSGLATIDQAGVDAQSTLAEIQEQATTSTEQVSTFVEVAGTSLDQTKAEMTTSLKQAISRRVAGLEAQAASLRGPTGRTGAPGSGVAVINSSPSTMNLDVIRSRYGRDLVPADIALQQITEGLAIWSYTGESWERTGLIPVQVRVESRPLSIYDASTKVYPTLTKTIKQGGGGNGQEKYSINEIRLKAITTVATGGNWVMARPDAQDPRSGVCNVELQALDGPNPGERFSTELSFVLDQDASADGVFTSGPVLGTLGNSIAVELRINRQPLVVPGGVTATPLVGAQCSVITLEAVPEARGNANGANRFALSGGVIWNFKSTPKVLDATDQPSIPAWRYD